MDDSINEKKAFINGWNAAIDTVKKNVGWRSMDVDGNRVTFEVQKMQQYLTCIKRNIPDTPESDELITSNEMKEYAELKVKEQRDLMATYLATHFNMRNVPKPKI